MYNRSWGADRRRFQRLSVNLSVAYEVYSPENIRRMLGGKEVEATALDLGGGGMAVLTKHNIPIWSTLLIKFLFFKTDPNGLVSFSEPVDIVGEVRSTIAYPRNEYRLGIAFKGVENRRENRVADLAHALNRP